jgi:hypothetical protein
MKRRVLAAVAVSAAVAPASASAATIELASPHGSPVIAYTARGGEVNAPRMSGTVSGFDLRMPFFEFSAPLVTGTGCTAGSPALCGAVDRSFAVEASLGDEDDIAYLNSFISGMTLDAGSGSDDVLAGGFSASADGGTGNDTIFVAASNGATGNGGPGRDRVAGGLGAVAAILTGGSQADLLVPDGSLFDTAEGGSGNDRLVSFTGRDVTLSGQSGSDVLTVPTGRDSVRRELNGGPGSDIVVTHIGAATVDGGSGHDVIDVRGGAETAPDAVACGSGSDVVWADADDSVAGDCEKVIRHGTPPTLRKAVAAETGARDLLAHRPDPSAAVQK